MTSDADSLRLADPSTGLAERRSRLFRETLVERLERWALGITWAMKPERVGDLPALARIWLTSLADQRDHIPPVDAAVANAQGLCGMVHDFSPAPLMEGYRRGLFTLCHTGPSKWYAPMQRCVLHFDELHIGKRVRRELRQGGYRVTFDQDFDAVVKACAGRRQGKWHLTWITPRVMSVFAELYDAGDAHSFEVWDAAGALVGGGYGVAVGGVFVTESQFSLASNTSKIGFTVLNWHLAKWGFVLNDGKYPTPTLLDMNFRSIPRAEFVEVLSRHGSHPIKSGRWAVEADMATIANWQPGAEACASLVPLPPKSAKAPKLQKAPKRERHPADA